MQKNYKHKFNNKINMSKANATSSPIIDASCPGSSK